MSDDEWHNVPCKYCRRITRVRKWQYIAVCWKCRLEDQRKDVCPYCKVERCIHE